MEDVSLLPGKPSAARKALSVLRFPRKASAVPCSAGAEGQLAGAAGALSFQILSWILQDVNAALEREPQNPEGCPGPFPLLILTRHPIQGPAGWGGVGVAGWEGGTNELSLGATPNKNQILGSGL